MLDLRDLLVGESANGSVGNLANYIHFEKSGTDTIVHISSGGGFSADTHNVGTAYTTGAEDQRIVLTGADLVSANTTDAQIIAILQQNNKLITD